MFKSKSKLQPGYNIKWYKIKHNTHTNTQKLKLQNHHDKNIYIISLMNQKQRDARL